MDGPRPYQGGAFFIAVRLKRKPQISIAILCSVAGSFQVSLTEEEIKLIVVALRQVRHTFAVARQQSESEELVSHYEAFDSRYQQLHDKLVELLGPSHPEPSGEGKLHRVK